MEKPGKIPIFCSLLPVAFFERLGGEPVFLTAEEIGSVAATEYHCAFHENICSYSKSLYDYLLAKQDEFAFIVIPSSCDAMKKLYSALCEKVTNRSTPLECEKHTPEVWNGFYQKLFLLDFPKNKDEAAVRFFASELERLDGLLSTCRGGALPPPKKREPAEGLPYATRNDTHLKLGIIGSNVSIEPFETVFKRFGVEGVYINQCLEKAESQIPPFPPFNKGGTKDASPPFEKGGLGGISDEEFLDLARYYISNNRCPRTNDEGYKKDLVLRIKNEGFDGIIINTLKFCDFYIFDHIYLKRELGDGFHVLNIEHDLMSKDKGQIMTRVEAFLEKMLKRGGRHVGEGLCPLPKKREPAPARQRVSGGEGLPYITEKYFVGIDSGSHATKLVCVDQDKNIMAEEITLTGTSVSESAVSAFDRLLAKAGITKKDVARIVATGYGRNGVRFADDIVTEITCHAIGANHVINGQGTVIDIGGQDSKAIRIDKDGNVQKFVMNDKCAAGTGHFLETMAVKLQISLEEFARQSLKAKGAVSVSSMCSVFAESEVISLIASGKERDEIAKGIHQSIAARTVSLVKRIEGAAPYYMTGGVAKNPALVAELSGFLGDKVNVVNNPQIVGALGAAIYAMRQ